MEWRKVYRKKKVMAVLLALFFFQIFYFAYSAYHSETDNSSGEYLASADSYVRNYHSSVEALMQQADSMGAISIFSQADSFSQHNLEKTKEDFEPLLSVTPVLIDGRFLTEFFSCSVLNGIAVICGIIIAFALVDENKRGLRSMIFSAVGGRGKLILEKFGALFFWNMAIVLLFYGGVFLESLLIYKGDFGECLSIPVQSLPLFQNLPWKMDMGSFLGVYFLYRFVLLLFVSLAVWTIVFLVENLVLAGGVIGILGGLSFVFYQVIGSSHPLNFLHYCNLWYQIEGHSFFTEYKNLNIASHAVNKNVASGIVFAVCFIGCFLIAFCVGSRRYPCRSQLGRIRRGMLSLVHKVQNMKGWLQERLPFWAVEFYKVIISQKGLLVILLLLFLFIRQTDFTKVQWSGRQEMYYDFMENYLGRPTAQSKESIENLRQELEAVEKEYLEALEAYEKGLLSEDECLNAVMKYEAYDSDRQFLEMIQGQTSYLEELEQARGIKGWYINSYSYNHLFERESSLQTIILILGAVLLCSGIFVQEQRSGMAVVLKSSLNGRGRLFRQKTAAAVCLALILLFLKEGLHISSVMNVYGLKGLSAPVQSYYQLSFLPFACSMGMFLIMVYAAKILMMIVLALFTCMLSAYTNQKAAIGTAFIFCIPTFLSLAGFEGFRYISVLNILSIVPFLLEVENVPVIVCVVILFCLIGAGCSAASYRKWCVVSPKYKALQGGTENK